PAFYTVVASSGTDVPNQDFGNTDRELISFAISATDKQVYRHVVDMPSKTFGTWVVTAPGQFLDIAVTDYGPLKAPVVFGLGVDHKIYEETFDLQGHFVNGWVEVAPGFFDALDVGQHGDGNPFLVGVGTTLAAHNQVFYARFDSTASNIG